MARASRPRFKILLLVPHLGLGGAQHVLATLARNLDKTKYEVHLGLLTQSSIDDCEFSSSITVHCLGATRARYATPSLVALVRRIRPAVILSGMAHLGLLVLLLRFLFPSGTRIIVRQNGSLSAALAARRSPLLARLLFAFSYRRASAIICQTQATATELQSALRLEQSQFHVLPNPVDIDSLRGAPPLCEPTSHLPRPYLLAAGRLVPEKGFDLLLESFATLAEDYPAIRLLIAGQGPCMPALTAQCQSLGIADRVVFPGSVSQLSRYFPLALAFVLSSRQDELPNALLEAAAAGLPIIATPSSPGLAALLRNQPAVWLAPSISANSLHSALRSALPVIESQPRFHHAWIEPFELKTAVAAYEALIDQTLAYRKA